MANIHLIGGEKGGVGKSMMARVLAQYMIDRNIPYLGFDTDTSNGALMRFYSNYASPVLVERTESLDLLVEAATEHPEKRILVDLAAQTHDKLVAWMNDADVLETLAELGLSLTYWHVMDSGKDSVTLLKRLLDRFGSRLDYVLVLNELRGEAFDIFEKSGEKERALGLNARIISLKRLDQDVITKIDAGDASFWAAQHQSATNANRLGVLERQRVKVWLKHAGEQIDSAGV